MEPVRTVRSHGARAVLPHPAGVMDLCSDAEDTAMHNARGGWDPNQNLFDPPEFSGAAPAVPVSWPGAPDTGRDSPPESAPAFMSPREEEALFGLAFGGQNGRRSGTSEAAMLMSDGSLQAMRSREAPVAVAARSLAALPGYAPETPKVGTTSGRTTPPTIPARPPAATFTGEVPSTPPHLLAGAQHAGASSAGGQPDSAGTQTMHVPPANNPYGELYGAGRAEILSSGTMVFNGGLAGYQTPPHLPRGDPPMSEAKTARTPLEPGATLFEKMFGINPRAQASWDLTSILGDMELQMTNNFKEHANPEDEQGSVGPDQEGLVGELKEAASKGFGLTRTSGVSNPVASRWVNALKASPELKKAYAECVNEDPTLKKRDNQMEFRKRWAKKEFVIFEQKRTKTKELVEIEDWVAEYLPFGRLWEKEGRDPAGYMATVSYVSAAAALQTNKKWFKGRPWCIFHTMTNRVRWLWIEEKFRGEMRQTWTTFVVEMSQVGAIEDGGDQEGEVAAVVAPAVRPGRAITATAKASAAGKNTAAGKSAAEKGAARSKAKGKGKAKPPAPAATTHEEKAKELKKQWKAALVILSVLKDDLNDVSSSFAQLTNNIAKDQSWSNIAAELLDPLRKARELVENKRSRSSFWKLWDSASRQDVKWYESFSESAILAESRNNADELRSSIEALNKIIDQAKSMHAQVVAIKGVVQTS